MQTLMACEYGQTQFPRQLCCRQPDLSGLGQARLSAPWPPSRGSGGAGIAAARPIAFQAPQCLRLQVQTLSCSAPCEPISDDPSVCSAIDDCKNALRHRASAAASDSPWQRPPQRLYRSERPGPPPVRRKKSLHPPAGPPTATSPASRAAGNVCQAVQGGACLNAGFVLFLRSCKWPRLADCRLQCSDTAAPAAAC